MNFCNELMIRWKKGPCIIISAFPLSLNNYIYTSIIAIYNKRKWLLCQPCDNEVHDFFSLWLKEMFMSMFLNIPSYEMCGVCSNNIEHLNLRKYRLVNFVICVFWELCPPPPAVSGSHIGFHLIWLLLDPICRMLSLHAN